MTKIDDGGAAFPTYSPNPGAQGMTLRDWFAGQALVGVIAGGMGLQMTQADFAHAAYAAADAMIAARKDLTDD